MNIVLVGMLAPAFWWHVDHCSLKQLEQSLLHTLSADVARYGGVIALAGNLVNLVNEHYSPLGSRHIKVGDLQQTAKDALDILANIAGLREHGGINDGEGDIKKLGYGACKKCLACTRGANHYDIALLYLHTILAIGLLQTLVMIVHRYCQMALGLILPDDVLVEVGFYLARLWHLL